MRRGRPIESYDSGCQIGLRLASVIGSNAASRRVARSLEMIPQGFVFHRNHLEEPGGVGVPPPRV